MQIVVTKHLSATELVVDIKKVLAEQSERVLKHECAAHKARSLVEALHEKAQEKTYAFLIREGGILPNPKHLDWENDTDPSNAMPNQHTYHAHDYERGHCPFTPVNSKLTRIQNSKKQRTSWPILWLSLDKLATMRLFSSACFISPSLLSQSMIDSHQ